MMSSRLPRDVNGAAVASISVAASTAGRSPRVPDGSTAGGWSTEFLRRQEPLGEEFEKVLFDNLWELYAR